MKTLKSTLLTLAALLCSTVASAYDFQVDGIFYNITDSYNLTVEVTYESDINGIYNSYSGDVVIPDTVTYDNQVYKVTKIGSCAFRNSNALTSVVIPEGVTLIEILAFLGCNSLSSIVLPESVISIGDSAFSGCSSLTEIHIASIESWLKINYGVNDSHPSSHASNVKLYIDGEELTQVEIPSSMTLIPSHAFRNCSSLTSITLPESVTSIRSYAFAGCSNLTSFTLPDGVTSIGGAAFENCSSLTSITIPASVTSIDNHAFNGCVGLKELIIADSQNALSLGYNEGTGHGGPCGDGVYVKKGLFYGLQLETLYLGRNIVGSGDYILHFWDCTKLNTVELGNYVTNILWGLFMGCNSLASINIPEDVTSIGGYAFSGCSSLASITIPESVTSIGINAFNNSAREIIIESTTPPTLYSSSLISDYAVITVPKEAYSDYSTATYWADLLANMTIDDARVKNLTLAAEDDKSALHLAIGDEDLKFVTNLTISGTINSYDFMILRNKMPVLRHLNLENASIVANAYEHYTGHHTEDNQFPGFGLYNCRLFSLTFPKNITSVGTNGVANNTYLSEVILFEGVTSVDDCAFSECDALTAITLPKGLATIAYQAFYSCDRLAFITFPDGLTSIDSYAFRYCGALESVVLPPTVTTIGYSAFRYCHSLKEIRIPSSIRSVGNEAFQDCGNLNDVYVYTVEPINIGQDTFTKNGNNFKGKLHAPIVSYSNYYYHTQWGQFSKFEPFDEPYENFYLNGDKELNNSTGAINGTEGNNPDAEMGNNSGLIVGGDVNQNLGDVDIEHNGTDGGSIIVDGSGCVNADKLHFHINVQGGRWYFFCFPFDVKREDIVLENGADWVFRYYDGQERAKNGSGGWKNVTSDGNGNHLKAATGYIFQCSNDDVLILTAKNQKIKQEKKYNELVEHVTANMHDASWNFVGNPYLSYYEVTSEDYSAPITVWDGEKYIAIRPGDDDYQLAPFEAFFVQKPEGTANIEYDPEQQMTYTQAQKAATQARARRRAMPINPDRLLVNITLSNGTDSDQTRVVFNNDAAMGYETACDAAKFSTAGVPQLYTIDSRAVKYAINERPVAEGIVTLGYSVPAQGNYTLAAPRMDTPVAVKDNLTGTIHNFAEGDYTFMSEAGTFEGRFTIMMKAGETGIENSEFNIENSELYNVKGQRVENADEQGIYIKNNRKVVSL